MRYILFILLCLYFPFFALAQKIGEWQVYPSYWNATQNMVVGSSVYSLCDGNLLAYDTEDTSIHTYNCLNELNDVNIQRMAYCPEAKKILLVYQNGNIDLMDLNDNVQNLSSLRDKTLPDKTIQDIVIHGTMAYLCMNFGFIEIDMQEGVFRNTYQLGKEVLGLGVIDGCMKLISKEGCWSCDMSKNMHDLDNWTLYNTTSNHTKAVCFNGKMTSLRFKSIITIEETNNRYPTLDKSAQFTFLQVFDGKLVYGNDQILCIRDTEDNVITLPMESTWNNISIDGNMLWASDGPNGLKGYKIADGKLTLTAGPIQPNSPKHDFFYRMNWVGDRLLIAGGQNTIHAIYNDPTAMYYQDGKWTILQEITEFPEEYTKYRYANTTHLVQDPLDDTHHFASLHRNGLAEYKDGKCIRLYNSDNSPIRSTLPNSEYYYNYCSCSGLQYDANGNLWMLNSETDTIVRVLQNNGKWASLYYKELVGVSLCDDYLMHSSGLMFLNSRRMENRGFFCFDTNGTLTNTRDDRHILRTKITNQDGTSYTPDEFYCMAEDLDGRIWCGTNLGLFVIDDASTYFDDDFQFQQVKISRDDGSGLADYLLNGVSINYVTVDGANRKWIGTHRNGVYLISADGTEMIHHFTTDNSPLLSNTIHCITVNPVSGEVMIGTDAGLCSYISDATEAAEELIADNVMVYPNPVRPDYTGPIAIKGLSMNAEVKILSTSGQLVWSGVSAGGTCTWNGQNKQGRRVASGVYHVVANNAEGKKAVVTRIIVIR